MSSYPAILSLSTTSERYTFPVRWRSTGVLNGSSVEDALSILNETHSGNRLLSLRVTTHIDGKEYSSLVRLKRLFSTNEVFLTALPPRPLEEMPLSERFSVSSFIFSEKLPKTEYPHPLIASPLLSSPLLSSPLLSSPRFYQKMFQFFLTLTPKRWNFGVIFRACTLLLVLSTHTVAFSKDCQSPNTPGDFQSVKAEILYVNTQDGMVTLSHDAVPLLELPSNTGSYQITDEALLPSLRVGDRGWVSFIRRKTNFAIVGWRPDECL